MNNFDAREIARRIVALSIGLSSVSVTILLSAGFAVAAYFSLRLAYIVILILEDMFRKGGL